MTRHPSSILFFVISSKQQKITMSVQGWADATRQVKAYQDVEHQRIIDVYQSLLHGKIIPNTAADTISSIYNPLLQQGTRSESVITLWYILCDAVRVLGGDTELAERLIMLINCITKLPDVTDMQGNAITPEWKGAGVYWRDLPQLAMIFRSHAIGKASVCVCLCRIPSMISPLTRYFTIRYR